MTRRFFGSHPMPLAAIALVACLGLISGCLPYAAPPMRLGVGGGAAIGRVNVTRDDVIERSSLEDMFQIRAELMPLDAIPSLLDRDYDVGLGYEVEVLDADNVGGSFKHGPSVSGTYYPLRFGEPGPIGADLLWRLGLTFRADLLFANIGRGLERGGGLSVATSIGFTHFADGPFSGPDSAGWAYGEGGVEGYVEAAVRSMHGGQYFLLTAGLMIRIPASVGFFAIW